MALDRLELKEGFHDALLFGWRLSISETKSSGSSRFGA
jgi:hypothetical protein